MSDNKDHSIEGNTDVPAGLDVVPSVPGTYVGGHDMQGADGTTRTDRPGEILGTPIPDESRTAGREHEIAKADYVRSEVDRANREELPKLGGTVDDGWTEGDSVGSKAKTADLAPASRSTAANRVADAAPNRTTDAAKAAPAAKADSGISVKSGIDRG